MHSLFCVVLLALFAFSCQQSFRVDQHLATWTTVSPQQDASTYTAPPTGCTFHDLLLVARHGNRFPTSKNVKNLSNLQKRLASSTPNSNFQWLKNWVSPAPSAVAGQLSPSGQKVSYDLAKRYQSYFPSVLNVTYNADNFPIRSTYVSRTAQTALSFAYGLFQGTGSALPFGYNPVWVNTPSSDVPDYLLRFYDVCPNLSAIGTAAAAERTAWEDLMFPSLANQLSQLTGIANITQEDLTNLWTGCQAESGLLNKTDSLCTLFNQTQIEAMEYWEDLDQYYTTSYGYDINWQIASPLLQEIATRLSEAANSTSPLPRMYFGHAETIFPLVAILGLYKDDTKLFANASQSFRANRKFRGSVISPFGANVAFSLYKCPSATYQVRVLVNEKEMVLPGCSSVYCPLNTFLNSYQTQSKIDFNTLCTPPTVAPTTATPTTATPTTATPTTTTPTTATPTTATPTTATPTTAAPTTAAPTTAAPTPARPTSTTGTIINVNFANMFGKP